MSPKSQRPLRGAKTMSSPSSRPMEVSAASPTGIGHSGAKRSFPLSLDYKLVFLGWCLNLSISFHTVGRLYPPRSPKSVSAVPVSSQDPPVGSTVPAAPASPSESRTALEPSASTTPPSPKVLTSAPIAAVEGKRSH